MSLVIGTIDVGAPRNIGWAILSDETILHGSNLDVFIQRFAHMADGRPACLGFEAPLYIPRRDELSKITRQRNGEAGRPWSAGAGATVTTIGIGVVDYTLSRLKTLMPEREATLDWKIWPDEDALLVWEAFVSARNHAPKGEHWRDALTAAYGFKKAQSQLDQNNALQEMNVVSLAGLSLVRTGWCAPTMEILSQPCLVIRPEEVASL